MNAIAEATEAGLATGSPKPAPHVATPVTRQPMPAEYLSFGLGDQEHGIDIMGVQEIRCYARHQLA